MTSSFPVPAAGLPVWVAPVSARLRIARVALEAALAVDGVVGGYDGPLGLRTTRDGVERLVGVVAAADASGGYSVTLYLIVGPVPLEPLARRIRAAVGARIAVAGLGDELAQLDIVFEDIALGEGAS